MELHLSKNLTFGGIINNVQHRVAKNGKGWGMFTLEGYDESYEFRIFGEEYLKFRHFFIQNNFTFMKVLVKEGWTDRDTGKKGEPRLQFVEVKQLQDVLETFAKKLILLLNISDLETDFIHRLSRLFQENKGDNTVSFEIMELEKIKRLVTIDPIELENDEVSFVDVSEDDPEMEVLEIPGSTSAVAKVEEVEEIKVVTKLTMPSRKLKIKISNELLVELEKMQINFKLN
jgi:DNA polymerase-3 subunit alpha